MKSWYAISPRAESNQTEISIFDEIGYYGVSAKQFVDDLKNVPAGNSILLKIHSPGGEVFDGNVIFNALKRHAGGVVVQIEGLCASMASIIALAGAPVRMAANGFFMIHNPWGMAVGDAAEMRDQASLLEKIKQNMVSAYAAKSKKDEVMIEEWMDAETWFTAEQALAVGFVDEITDALPIAASANKFSRIAKFRNAPANLTSAAQHMELTPEELAEKEATEKAAAEAAEKEAADKAAAEAAEKEAAEKAAAETAEKEAAEKAASEAVEKEAAKVAAIMAKATERDEFKIRAEKAEAALAIALLDLKAKDVALTAEQTHHNNLRRSLGLSAAKIVPVIATDGGPQEDIVDRYLAITDPVERAKFFRENKAELRARQSGSGK
ncbi:MAG: head maturation protease, ClpP-related [Terrimicrobiaceae bacterium]